MSAPAKIDIETSKGKVDITREKYQKDYCFTTDGFFKKGTETIIGVYQEDNKVTHTEDWITTSATLTCYTPDATNIDPFVEYDKKFGGVYNTYVGDYIDCEYDINASKNMVLDGNTLRYLISRTSMSERYQEYQHDDICSQEGSNCSWSGQGRNWKLRFKVFWNNVTMRYEIDPTVFIQDMTVGRFINTRYNSSTNSVQVNLSAATSGYYRTYVNNLYPRNFTQINITTNISFNSGETANVSLKVNNLSSYMKPPIMWVGFDTNSHGQLKVNDYMNNFNITVGVWDANINYVTDSNKCNNDQCYYSTGTDTNQNYIEVKAQNRSFDMYSGSKWTYVWWVNLTSTAIGTFFGRATSTTNNVGATLVSNVVRCYANSTVDVGTVTLTANNKYMITCRYNGTHIETFTNAVGTGSPAAFTGQYVTSLYPFRLFHYGKDSGSEAGYINGYADDFMVFNYSLTQSQLDILYTKPEIYKFQKRTTIDVADGYGSKNISKENQSMLYYLEYGLKSSGANSNKLYSIKSNVYNVSEGTPPTTTTTTTTSTTTTTTSTTTTTTTLIYNVTQTAVPQILNMFKWWDNE
jgi:hypothetical protein